MKVHIKEMIEIDADGLASLHDMDKNHSKFQHRFMEMLNDEKTWISPAHACLDAHLFALLCSIASTNVENFFIEAGANNGLRQSNTLVFEQIFGWKGLLVEPVTYNYEKCRIYRKKETKCVHGCLSFYDGEIEGCFDDLVQSLRKEQDHGLGTGCTDNHIKQHPKLVKTVPCFTYESICSANNVPKNYGFFVLDVEGYERNVITPNCFQTHRPALICIETDDESVIEDIVNQDYKVIKKMSHNFFLGDTTL